MLKDLWDALVDTVRQSGTPVQITKRENLVERYVVCGQVHEFAMTPPSRYLAAAEMSDLQALIDRYVPSGGQCLVMISPHSICADFDESGARVFTASMKLSFSRPFQRLMTMQSNAPELLSHRAMLDLLKHDLSGCVDGTLVDRFARLRVLGNGASSSELEGGRERGVREYQRELVNAEKLPDMIAVKLPVYEQSSLRRFDATVGVKVEVDLETLQFRLTPEWEDMVAAPIDAREQARRALADQLGDLALVVAGSHDV